MQDSRSLSARPAGGLAVMLATILLPGTLLGAAAAHADGVVLRSGSSAYEPGRVVRTGERVKLKSGERVSILDRSGRTVEISKSGSYAGAPASGGSGSTVARSVRRPGPVAAVGGSRGEDQLKCMEAARAESRDPEICRLNFAVKQETNGALSLSAQFDGAALCGAADGGAFLEGASPAQPAAIKAWTSLPLASGADLPASLRCHAVDAFVWSAFASDPAARETLTPQTAGAILSGYARVTRGAYAEADVQIAKRLESPAAGTGAP